MDHELRWFIVAIAGAVLGLCALLFGIVCAVAHLSFPVDVASVESLRVSASMVDAAEAEDVMGQVAEVNRALAARQAENRIPVWCLAVPNGWDDVDPIRLRGLRR